MGHISVQTSLGYYRVTEKRVRHAVNQVAQHPFDSQGRVFAEVDGLVAEEHARLRVGQVTVQFGVCTEPSNVKAAGHACPSKYSCILGGERPRLHPHRPPSCLRYCRRPYGIPFCAVS